MQSVDKFAWLIPERTEAHPSRGRACRLRYKNVLGARVFGNPLMLVRQTQLSNSPNRNLIYIYQSAHDCLSNLAINTLFTYRCLPVQPDTTRRTHFDIHATLSFSINITQKFKASTIP